MPFGRSAVTLLIERWPVTAGVLLGVAVVWVVMVLW